MGGILVTGSAGHLGEAILRTLRSRGETAAGLDIAASPFTDHVGSICDRDLVARCMDGARAVIHAATLHKPHVATHPRQAFIDTNVSGTLALLEAAASAGVEAFVFTSTTSAFGAALSPALDEPAAWITEDVAPIPKNIYGVTKIAAEGLCELFARRFELPVTILRTSRFFPEPDDDAEIRSAYEAANAQANELLNRRADIEDIVEAHLLAIEAAPRTGFARYIISATTPFRRSDLPELRTSAEEMVYRLYPECRSLFAARGWRPFAELDRVYDNSLARAELGWRPKYDFAHVLTCLRTGEDFRSPLARAVGRKGYHPTAFEAGPYPVA
ncbi:NAD-dependent epimerase/dehydratase family protein [Phenylobacterium sp.]|uniref:NAD-dependent epimerase/dehydratase family protein n=1 Tax=Phenylobacterium sp. TaxID=1871053 RepID=UPI003562BC08